MPTILEPLKIRLAKLEDIPLLLDLEQTFPGDRLERSNFCYFLTKSKADIWIAEEKGLGLGDAVVVYRKGSKRARLYSIVVSPKARGKGLGATLLAHAEKVARKRGCTLMGLEVREDNKAAILFYDSRGYEIVGRTDNYYEDGETALRMKKRL
jgi:[ribosomal protein S18]-alanine N-acetyltransferase